MPKELLEALRERGVYLIMAPSDTTPMRWITHLSSHSWGSVKVDSFDIRCPVCNAPTKIPFSEIDTILPQEIRECAAKTLSCARIECPNFDHMGNGAMRCPKCMSWNLKIIAEWGVGSRLSCSHCYLIFTIGEPE